MVASPKETIETFLRDIMEETFDIKIREPLKARINSRLGPIINEVGKNIDDDWIDDYKKNSISELLKSLDGSEYENIDFLKIFKDQLEEKLPSSEIILNEACRKTCNSVITEFRDIFIEDMIKNLIENEMLKQKFENAGIDGSLEDIKITIQPHLESTFENSFFKGTIKDVMSENKTIDVLITIFIEKLPSVASELVQKKIEEVNADALSIYLNIQVGSMVKQLNEIRTDDITSNHEIEPEKEQENNTHQILPQELEEKHYTIRDGEIGYTYETIFGPYLVKAKRIRVEDPYIRAPYQLINFVIFCELALKIGDVRYIELITSFSTQYEKRETENNLSLLEASLNKQGVKLSFQFNPKKHDRKIILDNGWVIKIGRGLGIYHPAENPYAIGRCNYELRPCRETDVDIYRND
jgi:hypothetical protein